MKFRMLLLLLLIMILPAFVGDYIPIEVKMGFLAFSITVKDMIVFLLPFMVFSFLFSSLISFGNKAIVFIIMLLVMVACSNFIAIITGYSIAASILPHLDFQITKLVSGEEALKPLFYIKIPKLLSNEPAIVAGILLGVTFAIRRNSKVEKAAKMMSQTSLNFLKRFFIPILPIFILGFIFKLEHDKVLGQLFGVYGPVVVIIISTQIIYLFHYYLLAAAYNPRKAISYIKNIVPAALTGFSTISSAATMPVTISCTEKNLPNPSFARVIVPATANIHTIGSALGITIFSVASLVAFGMGVPSFMSFLIFAFYYTMAKYAVAGIPGGVILIVTPLLQAHLGFTDEMVGLISAVYLLLDPFGTATNVSGNGAFAILFNKVYRAQEEVDLQSDASTAHINS